MAENKTQATAASPASCIAAIGDESRRHDCEQLVKLMSKATKQKPVMWGPAIVGFGTYRYPLASGKEGVICAVGFSSRKGDISLYGIGGNPEAEKSLSKLGTHKRGKGCLYIKQLADIDVKVLGQLVASAFRAKHV
jgi:hypothetical protein